MVEGTGKRIEAIELVVKGTKAELTGLDAALAKLNAIEERIRRINAGFSQTGIGKRQVLRPITPVRGLLGTAGRDRLGNDSRRTNHGG